MPNLQFMWLMTDHTAPIGSGEPYPVAEVADNDLAVGRVIDTISHSRFWKSTAIFVLEDDPQNGVDHVDGHRSVLWVVSPYSRGGVTRQYYTQVNVDRTIEQILGIHPMNQQDGSAEPMYDAFTATPNFAPYNVVPNHIPLTLGAPGYPTTYTVHSGARSLVEGVVPASMRGICEACRAATCPRPSSGRADSTSWRRRAVCEGPSRSREDVRYMSSPLDLEVLRMPKTMTLARIGAGAAALTLVAPAAAFAHGRPAVVKARPARAPRVCMALQATTLHGPLASLTADQLTALRTDCSTLQSAQQAAAPAIAAAQQAERSAVSSALAALKSACASSTSTTPAQPSADCLAAWSTFKSTVQSARTTYEQAVQTAVAPVVAAEKQLVSDLSADGIGVQAGHLARGHHHRGR